jgi:hypothetical protein
LRRFESARTRDLLAVNGGTEHSQERVKLKTGNIRWLGERGPETKEKVREWGRMHAGADSRPIDR